MIIDINTTHRLVTKREKGHGSWKQCTACGTTNHSGYWWYAGYKSKAEPTSCPPDKEWESKADTPWKDED